MQVKAVHRDLEVFISRSVKSQEIQHAPIFILVFNFFFHFALFSETTFGRDSDFLYLD